MALDYVKTSKELIEAVGGVENIASATHCMTRLRLILKDQGKADDKKVGKIKGVKSVIKKGGQYQIVIGNEVSNLFKEFRTHGKFDEGETVEKTVGNPMQRLFGFVAGCMTPLLPAMLGAGMVKVVLTILTSFAGLSTESSSYMIIYGMADAFFYFLPIFLGASIARKVGGSQPLYMIIGAMMCYPNLVSLLGGSIEGMEMGTFLGSPCTYLFGLPVIGAAYTSSVLPMLLMAPVMKVVEEFADRVSPNVLKAFLKPMLFLLICTPIAFILLGPVGSVLGNVFAGIFTAMYTAVPWLTVGVLSALMPFIVMTGMHYALIPLCMNNIATLGFDVIILVTMFCSNLAQGGSSFGVSVKSKNMETRSEGIASGISAVVAGITEPAMYGINLRFMTPMIAAVIGAGVSGLFCGLTNVVGYTMGGSPSMFSLVTFIGGEEPMRGVIFGAIGLVISVGLSFALTMILFKGDGVEGGEETAEEMAEAEEEVQPLVKKIRLYAPMNGRVVDIKDIPDEAFSSGVLGEGVAILPTDGNVYAPADGTVTTIMGAGHAIGITTEDGCEVLIHVGLETVELKGEPFSYKVKEGDKITRGQLLMTADLQTIRDRGYKLHTPVVITNRDQYVSIKIVAKENVTQGEEIITVA